MTELQEKIAEIQQQPFWQRAVSAQLNRPAWDPDQSVLHNLGSNVFQARQRGQDMIADQRQAMNLQSALEPGFAMNRLRHYWRHGDPVVTNPTDQLLLEQNFADLS